MQGKVGEFIITARKKGNKWFVAGLNNSNARTISVNFDFIEKAKFNMTICNDGVNAHNYGSDYSIGQKTIQYADMLDISMAPGGGFLIMLTPIR